MIHRDGGLPHALIAEMDKIDVETFEVRKCEDAVSLLYEKQPELVFLQAGNCAIKPCECLKPKCSIARTPVVIEFCGRLLPR